MSKHYNTLTNIAYILAAIAIAGIATSVILTITGNIKIANWVINSSSGAMIVVLAIAAYTTLTPWPFRVVLDKLKKNCSMYAYCSIVLVLSITFAGLGLYVLWLEVRRSAAYESLNGFTVESWKTVLANSSHQSMTIMDMAITVSILIACSAVMISPFLAAWVFLNRLDSRGSQNSQGETVKIFMTKEPD